MFRRYLYTAGPVWVGWTRVWGSGVLSVWGGVASLLFKLVERRRRVCGWSRVGWGLMTSHDTPWWGALGVWGGGEGGGRYRGTPIIYMICGENRGVGLVEVRGVGCWGELVVGVVCMDFLRVQDDYCP